MTDTPFRTFVLGSGLRTLAVLAATLLLAACSASDSADSAERAVSADSTVAAAEQGPRVVLTTSAGDITLALYEDESPITVENFLQYVDDEFYDGLIFHRVISGFMIQGGGFNESMAQQSTREPIQNEADNGLSNDRGTIAMARTQAPHSATAQFFINVADNSQLNQRGNQWGYAVFGEVVEGMDVVDRIAATETGTQPTPMGAMGDVPVEAIVIEQIRRLED